MHRPPQLSGPSGFSLDSTQTEDGGDSAPLLRVREFLAAAVREGAYAPGARLPTERELAARFNASRAAARRALAELEQEGLIERHVGRGTFVAQQHPEQIEPLTLAKGSVSPAEYILARLSFEPELAPLIVLNATAADFAAMDEHLTRGAQAASREEFELTDAAFHQCLARATHNTLVIAMSDLVHAVRHEQSMWFKLRQASEAADQRHVFHAEHLRIRDALMARDADTARALLVQHIRATRRRMLDF